MRASTGGQTNYDLPDLRHTSKDGVSNTRAYQSSLDVPPPSRILTTRIKTKLWHTQYAIATYPTDEVLPTRQDIGVVEFEGGGEATIRGRPKPPRVK